jgi:hypothetical protein
MIESSNKIKSIIIKGKRFDLDIISYDKFYNRLGHCIDWKDKENFNEDPWWDWKCNISKIGVQRVKILCSKYTDSMELKIENSEYIESLPSIYFIDNCKNVYDLKDIVREVNLDYILLENKNDYVGRQLFCNVKISVSVGLHSNNISIWIDL